MWATLQHNGKTIYRERAGTFYSTVLDVELIHLEAEGYAMKWFPKDEPHGGGGLIQGGGREPRAVGTVVPFNCGDDLNIVLDHIESAWVRVTLAKTSDEENGYVAFFVDAEGNPAGLESMG